MFAERTKVMSQGPPGLDEATHDMTTPCMSMNGVVRYISRGYATCKISLDRHQSTLLVYERAPRSILKSFYTRTHRSITTCVAGLLTSLPRSHASCRMCLSNQRTLSQSNALSITSQNSYPMERSTTSTTPKTN